MVLLSTSLAKYSASLRAPAVNQNLQYQRVIKEQAVPDEAEAVLSHISPMVDCGSCPGTFLRFLAFYTDPITDLLLPTQKGSCPLIMSHNVPYFLETAPADKT
jgi:hypothetical protein